MQDAGTSTAAPLVVESVSMGVALDDVVGMVRRRWIPIVCTAAVLLGVVVAWVYGVPRDDEFRSTAEVVLTRPGQDNGAQFLTLREVESEAQRAVSPELQAQVRDEVGAPVSLHVAVAEESDVLRFSAVAASPQLAADAANTYVRLHEQNRSGLLVRQLDSEIAVLEQRLAEVGDAATPGLGAEIASEIERVRTTRAFAAEQASEVISPARPPTAPIPRPQRSLLVGGAALALVVGMALGTTVDLLDRRLTSASAVEEASGAPVLATVRRRTRDRAGDELEQEASEAEAFRTLWANLRLVSSATEAAVLAITSCRPGEGKSTTASNLAVQASRSGQRVLLVDADLRRARLHEVFGLDRTPGLSDLIDQGAARLVVDPGTLAAEVDRLMDAVVAPTPANPRLWVLTAGPPTSAIGGVLSGDLISAFLARARLEFDLVIVDTPPLLAVADTLVLAPLLDGVVLVTTPATSDRREVKQVARTLARHEAEVLGVVVNRVDSTSRSYRYYEAYPYYAEEVGTVTAESQDRGEPSPASLGPIPAAPDEVVDDVALVPANEVVASQLADQRPPAPGEGPATVRAGGFLDGSEFVPTAVTAEATVSPPPVRVIRSRDARDTSPDDQDAPWTVHIAPRSR